MRTIIFSVILTLLVLGTCLSGHSKADTCLYWTPIYSPKSHVDKAEGKALDYNNYSELNMKSEVNNVFDGIV